eukprot:g5518.t1
MCTCRAWLKRFTDTFLSECATSRCPMRQSRGLLTVPRRGFSEIGVRDSPPLQFGTGPPSELQSKAQELRQSGFYHVMERFVPREKYSELREGEEAKHALLVDVETTGLEEESEVIEVACVLFSFTRSGRVLAIEGTYTSLRDPKIPIPDKIQKMTGITDDLVKGRTVDADQLGQLIARADLLLAHGVKFDRPFLERTWPDLFHNRYFWGCTCHDIPWHSLGLEGRSLKYLAYAYNFTYDPHRALPDCLAAVHLLAQPLPNAEPGSDQHSISALLGALRSPKTRLWAKGAPFLKKDLLKKRGYRWQVNGEPCKAWYIDLTQDDYQAELDYLRADIFDGHLPEALPQREVRAALPF